MNAPRLPKPEYQKEALRAMGFDVEQTAQEAKCPICERIWTITPWDDCLVPACGCYGAYVAGRVDVPCESCGLSHAWSCPNIPGRASREEEKKPNARSTQ